MSFGPAHRNLRGRKMKSISLALIERELPDVVRQAVVADPRPAKQLARDVGCVPRQVENWRAGESLPNLPNFLALAREIPELRAAALRWLEADRESDPEAERLTLELLQTMQRHLEARQRRLETIDR